ncbi:hypothetical protein HZS_5567 [Henneguya salminicola]|nr:hypothetical protein HZS_5567 [Henneguya salminicola]
MFPNKICHHNCIFSRKCRVAYNKIQSIIISKIYKKVLKANFRCVDQKAKLHLQIIYLYIYPCGTEEIMRCFLQGLAMSQIRPFFLFQQNRDHSNIDLHRLF